MQNIHVTARVTWRLGVLAATFAMLAASVLPASAAPPGCLGRQLGQLPMVPVAGHVVVPVRFGTEPRSMAVDTGANNSVLFKDSLHDVGLSEMGNAEVVQSGVGGVVRTGMAEIPSFNFDGIPLKSLVMGVVNTTPPKFDILPVVGFLGTSILSVFDLEMDFPGQTMTLYDRPHCADFAPPWSGAYTRVPLIALPDNLRDRLNDDVASSVIITGHGASALNQAVILVDVSVNGRTLRALLDTGSPNVVLTPEAAERVGLAAAAKPRHITLTGVDLTPLHGDVRTISDMRIGAADLQNVRAGVVPIRNAHADMILGLSVFRSQRIWISFAGKALFFQPSDSKP